MTSELSACQDTHLVSRLHRLEQYQTQLAADIQDLQAQQQHSSLHMTRDEAGSLPPPHTLDGRYSVLPFLFFGKRQGKQAKKTRFFSPNRTPKIREKEGRNTQKKTRKSLQREKKTRNSKKTRKGRTGYCAIVLRSRPPFTGVPRGPSLKVPHGVLFEQFWAPASECPKECFLSAFWGPKQRQKALFGGTPRQARESAQKALRGTLSGSGPSATPVNGGRDRKTIVITESQRLDGPIRAYHFSRVPQSPCSI